MTDTNWTVALAGTGEVTPENAEKLLDDWLPVEGVGLLFPKLPRNAKTMRHLVKWAEEENIDIMQDQEDLISGLVGARGDGDQVYLVLAWDDTEASSKLLEQAISVDIEVKDLTRALDDLEFEDEPDVPTEPANTSESRGRRGSKRGAASDEAGTDAASTTSTESDDNSESDDVAGAPDATPVLPDASGVVQVSAVGPAVLAPQALGHTPDSFTADLTEIIRAIVRDEYEKLTAEPEKATVPVLIDPDGNYRLGGKGRPRKGETAGHLTPTEAREMGLLIDAE